MAELKTILAVAVGPQKDVLIRDESHLSEVRPYIRGLIAGLTKLGHRIGADYVIDYRERDQNDLGAADTGAFAVNAGSQGNLIIFGMSTTVVQAAASQTTGIPIVGTISEPQADGLDKWDHVCTVSGRRSQTAGDCCERFLDTVPSLKEVRALHKPGYGPSERALTLVEAAARARRVAVTAMTIASRQDIETKLSALPERDLNVPPDIGVQVLPVDVCLGAAPMIIELAQEKKKIPVFFPIPDWVKRELPSALGAYGIAQHTCGELCAATVDDILWRQQHPTMHPNVRRRQAADESLTWVVSAAAAKALNIKLDSKVPVI